MTVFIEHPQASGLIKLAGVIKNYQCHRGRASFVFTQADKSTMGAVAIGAGLAGLSGQAIAIANNSTDLKEEADYVEFKIDDHIIKGWVWRSPFKEGDFVEVAAEQAEKHLEVFGIARPIDRIIALYPHCSRSIVPHYLNAIRWWLIISTSFHLTAIYLSSSSLEKLIDENVFQWGAFGSFLFFGAMVLSLSKKWLPFVRVAENVFKTLGWSNALRVDLKKITKRRRTSSDAVECGVFYFHY